MNKYRDMIASGQLDVGFLNKLDTNYRLLANQNLTDGQRNAINFMADMEDLRNTRLLEAKGVQTEGDAQRAMQAILPGQTGYNSQAVLGLLDRATGDLSKAYQKHLSYNEPLVRKYGADITDPDAYNSIAAGRRKSVEDFEKNFGPKRDAYLKSSQTSNDQSGSTVTGQPQRTNPQATPQYREGQTATGPGGQKKVFRGGKWEPL
jgi:hypothetical protein